MRPLRIAKLTRYDGLSASTRQRFDQYDPFLAEIGCSTVSLPLIRRRVAGAGEFGIVRDYANRLGTLLCARAYDLLWIHCEVLPFVPGWLEASLLPSSVPMVVDFDDAMFHNYDDRLHWSARWVLRDKLGPLLRRADAILCGNQYIRDYAEQFSTSCHYVPTVLDTNVYKPGAAARPIDRQLSIGWLGSPSTWDGYLVPMLPLLLEEAERAGAIFHAVGASSAAKANSVMRVDEWSPQAELDQLQSIDVGVMPLDNTRWARGKCGYKLIQYMACGSPVVASPVGVNCDLVEVGVNGFLAADDDEWRTELRTLLSDTSLRNRMGAAGRAKIEANYSIQTWGPRIASLLRDVAERGTRWIDRQ